MASDDRLRERFLTGFAAPDELLPLLGPGPAAELITVVGRLHQPADHEITEVLERTEALLARPSDPEAMIASWLGLLALPLSSHRAELCRCVVRLATGAPAPLADFVAGALADRLARCAEAAPPPSLAAALGWAPGPSDLAGAAGRGRAAAALAGRTTRGRHRRCGVEDRGELDLRAFIDAVERGELAGASALLDSPAHAAHHPEWQTYEALLVLMQSLQIGRPLSTNAIHRLAAEFPDAAASVLEQVFRAATGTAASMAELATDTPAIRRQVLGGSSLRALAPLRCAVILGHSEVAMALLAHRRAHAQSDWLDDCFQARLLAQAGQRDRAAARLETCRQRAEAHGARERLAFELALSRELSPLDLLAFGRAIAPTLMPTPAARRRPTREADSMPPLVGESPPMRRLRDRLPAIAGWDLPVLLLGDTGTGKDLVARHLHAASRRADQPLVAINCAGVTENLLESELFGHAKGAFTGAEAARRGLLASAGEGTVFLDEIGDSSPGFQANLLRLLESGEYRPVGSDRSERLAARIIAATNADIDVQVAAGRFREDLLYRLRRMEIELPPLAQRREDIPLLAEHFLAAFHPTGDDAGFAPDLREVLCALPWPGNVRQLRSEVEALVVHDPQRTRYELDDFREAGALRHDADERARLIERARNGTAMTGETERRPATAQLTPGSGNPRMRRLAELRRLFAEHQRLTRKEVIALLGITSSTASSYLKELCADGAIERVEPTPAPGSHYFVLAAPERGTS
ncbi:MAG: sigma 54-interacting transcriptional regulator [Planctomycetota bacterium]